MSHIMAFHQGLHCLLDENSFFRTEVHHFVEILTSSPLRKKIDYSVLVAIHQKWKGLRLIAQDSCMIH